MHTDSLRPLALWCYFVFLAWAIHSNALPAAEPNKQSSAEEESRLENLEFRAAICAHHLSSGLWVVGRDYQRTPEEVIAQDIAPFRYFGWSSDFKYEVDEKQRLVTVTAPGATPRSARYTGDQGSTILPRDKTDVSYKPISVPRNLPDAASQAWPMGDLGATESVSGVDTEAVAEALDWAMEQNEQNTRAFVVAYRGKIIGERYAPGWTKDTPQISWSEGKSITATLIGILIHRGLLTLDQPAPIKEWQGIDDPRREIRIRDLLNMSSGLDFTNLSFKGPETLISKNEHMRVYFDSLNVLEHAVNQPLKVPPGTRYSYLNSDPLSLGRIIRDTVESQGEDYLTFPQRALFDQIGARSVVLETDAWGNFIMCGYDYVSARDWTRFGLLYLNDGVWQGERILPEGWTNFVATPAPADDKKNYGGMFWLNLPPRMDRVPKDAYWAAGFMGQVTMVIPSHDLVIVRMGPSSGDVYSYLNEVIARIIEALPEK
ncbi:serine hydrolase domain-containing protein [Rubinisphaera italica]|uniref:6-aminohexanoate-dimer hydrolase n=1 Tax=Rubinisphaera italica TaxID=2527969 RepID=A0A5C5XD40_9PLAN|nr:serine hydrolase [Rubinisphaera italica]TWT60684.1 6-aminohexanoate-dimer hydrolase [Rubinisphaera italica]